MIFLLFGSSLARLEPKLELFEVWEIMVRQIIITNILQTALQGAPKKTHFQNATGPTHSELAQSPIANSPCVWKSIFWSFLTKIKQDPALQSHVHGKIWPHSAQFWLCFFPISTFFWDTL